VLEVEAILVRFQCLKMAIPVFHGIRARFVVPVAPADTLTFQYEAGSVYRKFRKCVASQNDVDGIAEVYALSATAK